MTEPNIETVIKSGVEKALNKPIADGKSITQWAAIGMKAPRWISVKDRLPEKDGEYLVYVHYTRCGYLQLADFTTDRTKVNTFRSAGYGWSQYDDDYGHCDVGPVTHWMPLPEPPEEVTGDD